MTVRDRTIEAGAAFLSGSPFGPGSFVRRDEEAIRLRDGCAAALGLEQSVATEAECLAAIEQTRHLCRRHVARERAKRDAGKPHTMPPTLIRRMAQIDSERSRWPDGAPEWIRETFDGPCEGAFIALRHQDPEALLALVTGGALRSYDLTFAAEQLGYTDRPPPELAGALLPLLDHESPVVREGAMLALSGFEEWPEDWSDVEQLVVDVRARLERVAKEDASKELRGMAAEMLEPS